MKIWLIKIGEETPLDKNARLLRTGQLFLELAKTDNVTWFNCTFNHQKKKQRFNKTTIKKFKKNSEIVYLYNLSYNKNISLKRFISQIYCAFEFYKFTKKKFELPDIIISSYPTVELTWLSCVYAKRKRIPYILDVRDMWPDVILKKLHLSIKIFFLPFFYLWKKMFIYSLKNSKKIFSITKEFLEWSLSTANIKFNSKKHIYFYLTKTPHDKNLLQTKNNKLKKFINNVKNDINIIFCGSTSERHNFQIILEAFANNKNKNINFIFCGNGKIYDTLKKKFDFNKNIFFLGWLNNNDLNSILKNCDYGLLPYSGEDFNISYPNKLAEYLSNNLKIITCIGGITKELIIRKKVGYFYKENSYKSFFNLITKIAYNKDNNSYNLYKQMFNFKKIMKKKIDTIKSIKIKNNKNK